MAGSQPGAVLKLLRLQRSTPDNCPSSTLLPSPAHAHTPMQTVCLVTFPAGRKPLPPPHGMRREAKGGGQGVSRRLKGKAGMLGGLHPASLTADGMERTGLQAQEQSRPNLHQEAAEWVVCWRPWKRDLLLRCSPPAQPCMAHGVCLLEAEPYQHSPGQEDKSKQEQSFDSQGGAQETSSPGSSRPADCAWLLPLQGLSLLRCWWEAAFPNERRLG